MLRSTNSFQAEAVIRSLSTIRRRLTQDNYLTFETDYAPRRTQYWHGVDVNFTARPSSALAFQGGTSTGRGVRDHCALVRALPELFATGAVRQPVEACATTEPFLTQFRGVASYTIPKIDVTISAGIQSKPGTLGIPVGLVESGSNGLSMAANVAVTNAVSPSRWAGFRPDRPRRRARRPSTCCCRARCTAIASTRSICGSPRPWPSGRTRTLVGLDLYNLFNVNPTLSYNQAFAANWPRPTSILLSRFLRFNATVNF